MKTLDELNTEFTGILKVMEGVLLNQEILSSHLANNHEALHGIALCLLNSAKGAEPDDVIEHLHDTMGKFSRRLLELNADAKALLESKGYEMKNVLNTSRIIQPS